MFTVHPGIKNKFLYIFMPPGWSHTGDHKTAGKVRREYLEAHVKPRKTNLKSLMI